MRVIIFGAGSSGKLAKECLENYGYEVICFSDNNKTKWGSCLLGLPVLEPGALKDIEFDRIFIASTYASAIMDSFFSGGGLGFEKSDVEIFDKRKFSEELGSAAMMSEAGEVSTHFLAENLSPSAEVISIQEYVKSNPGFNLKKRALWNSIPYSSYAYGVYCSADLAKRLGLTGISVIEFGVAGGNGLLFLEEYAAEVSELLDIDISVYGFDTGVGMPGAKSREDMPHAFKEGNYEMDEKSLKSKLNRAELIIGDAVNTFSDFLENSRPSPIGFIAFDLDHYWSTIEILKMIGSASQANFLPRVQSYFDNCAGRDLLAFNEYAGELAAIRSFNELGFDVKVCENRYFRTLPFSFEWFCKMYVLHRFGDEMYGHYINNSDRDSLSLKK